MPKKKQRNSFYFFMREKRELLNKQGRKLSMLEVANIAGPEWKKTMRMRRIHLASFRNSVKKGDISLVLGDFNAKVGTDSDLWAGVLGPFGIGSSNGNGERLLQELSAAEKEVYERMAVQHKDQQRDYIGSKLASDGTSIQENLELEEEEKQKEKRMHSAVKDLIISCSRNKDLVAREPFYVISFNILCCTEDDDFIPVEIGMLEYSIQEGLNRYHHKFIYPGTIPTGYTGEAKRHSEATHQIPINGHEMADQNYQRILQELKNFIVPSEIDILPPLFCLNAELDQTVGCLRWLAEKSGQLCAVEIFKVWDLKYLLLELREVAEKPLLSSYLAHDLLHKNNFDYTPDTRCSYHEELDISYCALGTVRRLGFLLSDALCGVYEVEVTEKHLPVRAQEAKGYEMHIPLAQTLNRNPEISRGIGRGLRPSFARKAFSDEDSHPSWRQPMTQAPLVYSTGRNNAENEREQLIGPPQPVTSVSSPQSRQPQTPSLAQEMGRLNLTDSVRGLGIGRGLVKKQ